ncbi:MAG: M3 family metallopeptidase, partial [Planctomycetota bacterium]
MATAMLPSRDDVDIADTWDLSSLFDNDDAWEQALQQYREQTEGYAAFQGRLGEGAETIAEMLRFDEQMDRLGERLGVYAFLKTTEDQSNADYQGLKSRFQNAAVAASQAASYIRPELLAIPADQMDTMLEEESLRPFQLSLTRLLRYRPHTLTDREERLIAMQGEMASTAGNAFRQLSDADMHFGTVVDHEGTERELTQSTFIQFLEMPDREIRKKAFHQYYDEYAAHENTLAATFAGTIHQDIYYSRARNYDSCLQSALFPDNVPVSVYDNLITAVRSSLPAIHEYLDVRRRKMGLDQLHFYDTYVPILSSIQKKHTWQQATDVVLESLSPLGSEYCDALSKGLNGRWSDRYPNKNKQSGAFSCGTFDGDPYILMNFKPDV